MLFFSKLSILLTCLVGLVPVMTRAQNIDFENLPAGTVVNAQYAPRGVIFFGAYIETNSNAHSGTGVLRSISPTAEVFTPGPLVMTFTSPQTRVAFTAGNFPDGIGKGTLKVFDSAGTLVGQDGPKAVPSNSFNAFFVVRAQTPKIVRAEFQIDGSALELIDDLIVEGNVATLPNEPPKVTITNPTEGAVYPEKSVMIRGTVTGDSVLDNIALQVTMGLPSDSTAPPSVNTVSLSGTGASRTFSLNYGVLTGPYTITAVATNTANLQGTATVHFSSLPDAIRARYQSDGGTAAFGLLRFASHDAGCVVAVFDQGLIAALGTQTFVVRGPIFQKWLATRPTGNPMSKLGCPTAEEHDALGGGRRQDFRHGRVYANGAQTAYVPEVFRDAIETLGGEETIGIATSDPTDSTAAMQTWLFQRFKGPGFNVEPSTLEIRGVPPVLYVERVGDGGLDELPSRTGLQPTTATVFLTFPCDSNLGPCKVKKPAGVPTITDGSLYCDGHYPELSLTEWQHMLPNDYAQTEIRGWVVFSKLACKDNPLTHDNITTNGSGGCSVGDLFPSDWQVYVLPVAPYQNLITTDQSYLEVEFEAYYAAYFFAGWGWPIAGDMIYVNGRWIMDCGHSPYKAEIHPPFLMSQMRTQKRTDGTSETVAQIWVTGYYPGDPIDLDLWPPPRPTPDAFLTVDKPLDTDAALGSRLRLAAAIEAPACGSLLNFASWWTDPCSKYSLTME